MSLILRRARDGNIVATRTTDQDGRCESPLMAGPSMTEGVYEIAFDVASWRNGQNDRGFYDIVTIRFVLDPHPGHVHIPLLLSPYGYSTYRGS